MHINSLSPYSTLPSFTIPKIEIQYTSLLEKNNMETLVRSMNTGFMTETWEGVSAGHTISRQCYSLHTHKEEWHRNDRQELRTMELSYCATRCMLSPPLACDQVECSGCSCRPVIVMMSVLLLPAQDGWHRAVAVVAGWGSTQPRSARRHQSTHRAPDTSDHVIMDTVWNIHS